MKSISAPICGDYRYADKIKVCHEERGYLHAFAIKFTLHKELFEFSCLPLNGCRFLQDNTQKIIKTWQKPWNVIKSK